MLIQWCFLQPQLQICHTKSGRKLIKNKANKLGRPTLSHRKVVLLENEELSDIYAPLTELL